MKKFALESGLRGVCWDFGCPGHGKGPWDGLAGTIKRTRGVDRERSQHGKLLGIA